MASTLQHEIRIRAWMTSHSAQATGRFDDLHLDRIDSDWKKRDLWLEAGLEAFRIAVAQRGKYELPFEVALAFSLLSDRKPLGVTFHDPASLLQALDWSPPSLYLFKEGEMPWAVPEGTAGRAAAQPRALSVKKLDPRVLGAPPSASCLLMEFRPKDSDEYSRTVLVIG